jgi:hypothetical protein
MAAEARITLKNDAHFGPNLTQSLHQQRQDRPGMLGSIDLAGSQITHQQLIATKYIPWQKAVVIVIAVEEATFLAAMDRIIRGIEVEDQLIGWLSKGGNELLEQ